MPTPTVSAPNAASIYRQTPYRRHIERQLGMESGSWRDSLRDVLSLAALHDGLVLGLQGEQGDEVRRCLREQLNLRTFFYGLPPSENPVWTPIKLFPKGQPQIEFQKAHLTDLVRSFDEHQVSDSILLVGKAGTGKTVAARKAFCDCLITAPGEDHPALGDYLPCWLDVSPLTAKDRSDESLNERLIERLIMRACGLLQERGSVSPAISAKSFRFWLRERRLKLLLFVDLGAWPEPYREPLCRALAVFLNESVRNRVGHRAVVAFPASTNDATLADILRNNFKEYELLPPTPSQFRDYFQRIREYANAIISDLPSALRQTVICRNVDSEVRRLSELLIQASSGRPESDQLSTPLAMHFAGTLSGEHLSRIKTPRELRAWLTDHQQKWERQSARNRAQRLAEINRDASAVTSAQLSRSLRANVILGGMTCMCLAMLSLLGWRFLGRTERLESSVTHVADDTRKILKNTDEIKEDIQNLSKLRGLVASPRTAGDFYHNANVHRNDGNFPLAEEAFLEYFKRKNDSYFDPYLMYLTVLEGRNFDRAKIAERFERVRQAAQADQGTRLLKHLSEATSDISELRQIIAADPKYLPAYLVLLSKLPNGQLIDDLVVSELAEQYRENGGSAGMKAFILDSTNKPGSDLLEAARSVERIAKVDPMQRLVLDVEINELITLLWAGVKDAQPGREIIFSIGDTELRCPLNSPENPALDPDNQQVPDEFDNGCFVALEITSSRKKSRKPRYIPRDANDVRIFPHAGQLDGLKLTDKVTATVSYIDASGRKYTFPKSVRLFGGQSGKENAVLFTAKIERDANSLPGDTAAKLLITPGESMKRIEVSGAKEGPYVPAFPHESIPTMNEVLCEDVPYLTSNSGVASLWVRAVTEAGEVVEPNELVVRVPAGLQWRTRTPRESLPPARELTFDAPEDLRYSDIYIDKLAFSPDSSMIAAQYERAGIVVWNLGGGKQLDYFPAKTTPALMLSKEGKSVSNGLFVFTLAGGKSEKRLEHDLDVFGMAISPDFSRVVTVDRYKKMAIFDFEKSELLRKFDLPESTGSYGELAISPDGKLVASSGQWVDSVPVINLATGEIVKTLEADDRGATDLAFSPDGKFLLAGGQKGKVWLWNLESGDDEAAQIELGNHSAHVAWAGGVPVVVEQGRQSITMHHARTGARIIDVAPASPKFALAPDGSFVAIADKTKIKLFELPDSKQP